MKSKPDHDSTPLSIDRFELEKRMSNLFDDRPDWDEREWLCLKEVFRLIGRMAEEGDAGISTFYSHGEH